MNFVTYFTKIVFFALLTLNYHSVCFGMKKISESSAILRDNPGAADSKTGSSNQSAPQAPKAEAAKKKKKKTGNSTVTNTNTTTQTSNTAGANSLENALHAAFATGNTTTITMLIKMGVNPDNPDRKGSRPIHKAIVTRNNTVLQCLLDTKNVDVNATIDLTGQSPIGDKDISPLWLAVTYDDEKAVDMLLKADADIFKRSARGASALDVAATLGKTAILTRILTHLASKQKKQFSQLLTDVKNPHGETPLFEATCANQPKTLKLLLGTGIDIKAQNPKGLTALHFAADNGYLECMELILEKDKKLIAENKDYVSILHTEDKDGEVALNYVATTQKISRDQKCAGIALLTKYGAINQPGRTRTVLASALVRKQTEDFEFLVKQCKVDPNLADKGGNRPLHLATSSNDLKAAQKLVSLGARTSGVPNLNNDDPIHSAAMAGHVDMLKFFIEDCKLPCDSIVENALPSRTCPPLILAAARNQLDAVKYLVEKAKANKDFCTPFNICALSFAFVKKYEACAEYLIDQRANTNLTIDGQSLLHLAAEYGWNSIISKLLAQGFDVDELDNEHQTALYIAAQYNKPDTVTLLLKRGAQPEKINALRNYLFSDFYIRPKLFAKVQAIIVSAQAALATAAKPTASASKPEENKTAEQIQPKREDAKREDTKKETPKKPAAPNVVHKADTKAPKEKIIVADSLAQQYPNLTFTGTAKKYIKRMTDLEEKIISPAVQQLNTGNLAGLDIETMTHKNQFRVRRGDYRIIYHQDPETKKITILDAGHRQNIYE